jgi:hypothetical protein
VPPAGALAAAPLGLEDDTGASAAWAPATEGALAAGAEELVLDDEALDGELPDWVSPDPTALSPVEPAVEELESSSEPDVPALPLVWEAASLVALPLDDSPPVVLGADA